DTVLIVDAVQPLLTIPIHKHRFDIVQHLRCISLVQVLGVWRLALGLENSSLSLTPNAQSGRPVRDKQIGFMGRVSVPVRCPDQMFAIGTETWKSVELIPIGDALRLLRVRGFAVYRQPVDLELASLRIRPIGSKDQRMSIMRPTRGEIGDIVS